jgi:hypothetical protein
MHWFPTAQIEIATTCLTYLSFDVFAEDYHGSVQETENQVQEYPLFRYAARFWGITYAESQNGSSRSWF